MNLTKIDLKIAYDKTQIKIDASKSDGQEIRLAKDVREHIEIENQIIVAIEQILKKFKTK